MDKNMGGGCGEEMNRDDVPVQAQPREGAI